LAADNMPDCLNITAMSEDNVVMALQHTEYPIYGVQFHLESILTYKNNVGIKIITNLINSL
jgi:anthranilate synthase